MDKLRLNINMSSFLYGKNNKLGAATITLDLNEYNIDGISNVTCISNDVANSIISVQSFVYNTNIKMLRINFLTIHDRIKSHRLIIDYYSVSDQRNNRIDKLFDIDE